MKRRLPSALLLSIALSASATIGCKRDAETVNPVAKSGENTSFLQSSLIGKIPFASYGFYHWSLKSAAYQRMDASPWKDDSNTSIDPSGASSSFTSSTTYQVFKDAGIDLMNTDELKKAVDELVVFLSPVAQPTATNPVDFGAILVAKSSVDFAQKFQVIRDSLTKHEIKVLPSQFGAAQGFEAEIPASEGGPTRNISVAYTKDYAVLGTSSAVVQISTENLAKGGTVPQSTSDANFHALTRSFGSTENRYGFGYVDLAKFSAAMKAVDPENVSWDNIPVRAAAVESWMAETPGTNAGVALWPRNEEQKSLLSSFNTPVSAQLLATLPASPMLFVGLDGAVLRFAKDSLAAENAPDADASPLAMAELVQRIVLSVKPAPVGQALVPVPEILIGIESQKPGELASALTGLGNSLLPPGAPAAPAERKVGNATINQIVTPLGVSISVAQLPNMVLLSTTDQQINASLQSLAALDSSFSKSLTEPQRKLIVDQPATGTIYIDFPQLSEFVESISSLMGMYGANPAAAQTESLAAMRQRGRLVGSAKLQNEILEISSFYTKSPLAP